MIAHSAYCPVLDAYNEMFLHPWCDGLPKEALGKIYGFEKDENGEYIYDESKVAGYNPVRNTKAKCYPVPVKFWQCKDDPVVSYEVTEAFIRSIKENGGVAYLRAFPYGQHEPTLVGDPIVAPIGNCSFDGEALKIVPAVEEAFIWIKNFDV